MSLAFPNSLLGRVHSFSRVWFVWCIHFAASRGMSPNAGAGPSAVNVNETPPNDTPPVTETEDEDAVLEANHVEGHCVPCNETHTRAPTVSIHELVRVCEAYLDGDSRASLTHALQGSNRHQLDAGETAAGDARINKRYNDPKFQPANPFFEGDPLLSSLSPATVASSSGLKHARNTAWTKGGFKRGFCKRRPWRCRGV